METRICYIYEKICVIFVINNVKIKQDYRKIIML